METKERVEWLLKSYHEMKRNLENLKLEIEHFSGLSYDQVIESLTFSAPVGERVQTSNVSDKSSRIALIYRDVAEGQNDQILRGLLEQFYAQKTELDMLEYRIKLLEPRLSAVVWDMFISGLTWSELCCKYAVSHTMIGNYRKKGIKELSKFYDLMKSVV